MNMFDNVNVNMCRHNKYGVSLQQRKNITKIIYLENRELRPIDYKQTLKTEYIYIYIYLYERQSLRRTYSIL